LNPEHPVTRGTAQNPDIYFQTREASNKFYDAIPDMVADTMKEISKITGRDYKPFVYYGAKDAENVIVAMGSVTETIKETVDYLMAKGEKVGVVTVHLYRPFSVKYLMAVLPESVKHVLRASTARRSREPTAIRCIWMSWRRSPPVRATASRSSSAGVTAFRRRTPLRRRCWPCSRT